MLDEGGILKETETGLKKLPGTDVTSKDECFVQLALNSELGTTKSVGRLEIK